VRDVDLIELARSCEDCLCWLEQCQAECCRAFTFYLTLRSDVLFGETEVRVHTSVSPDMKRYYELHGAVVDGDWVIVPREACTTTLDRLEVRMRCRELRADNRCGLHKRGKPRACSDFTLESAQSAEFVVMPRCLYRYKLAAAGRVARDGEGEHQ
jgi:hypothetical protein